MTASYVSAEDRLLEDVCSLMDSADCPPWQKPWSGNSGEHRNLISGHEYRGANPLLLDLGMMMRDSTIPLWLGSGQAKGQAWIPKKGSKSVRILRPQLNSRELLDQDGKPQLDAEGEPITAAWVSYKVVPVFNVQDLKGFSADSQAALEAAIATALDQTKEQITDRQRIHAAEGVIDEWPVRIRHGGTRACYSSSLDRIMLPPAETFTSRETYLATKLHEMAHSTGHSSRLDRALGNRFGSKAYAKEELIAEFASVLACHRLKIGYELPHHAGYLKSWASHIREGGSRQLLKLLSQARAAADLIAPEPEFN